MRDFSMFELAIKLAQAAHAEKLGTVDHISRRDFEERDTFAFRTVLPTLEYASLMIESALLLRTNRTGRVYAGFEKLSKMKPVADRYLRIADVSERVYVFGEPDWQPPRHPHLKAVPISESMKLASELFLIADSSTLEVALCARDEDRAEVTDPERHRFSAVKTSDRGIVSQLAAAAERLVDALHESRSQRSEARG